MSRLQVTEGGKDKDGTGGSVRGRPGRRTGVDFPTRRTFSRPRPRTARGAWRASKGGIAGGTAPGADPGARLYWALSCRMAEGTSAARALRPVQKNGRFF